MLSLNRPRHFEAIQTAPFMRYACAVFGPVRQPEADIWAHVPFRRRCAHRAANSKEYVNRYYNAYIAVTSMHLT